MAELGNINTEEYNYFLPETKIAKYPLQKRDESKLLSFKNGVIKDYHFFNLDSLLSPRDVLIFNDTRVINARFHFLKDTGAKIEIFCLEPKEPFDYKESLASVKSCVWKCLIGNNKKWKDSILKKQIKIGELSFELTVEKREREGDAFIIEFSWNCLEISFAELLNSQGYIPIPPYLNRKSEKTDSLSYQTVYASKDGSVAAPTAGLHFTDELLYKLRKNGVSQEKITLHVGAGTFQPIKTDDVYNHKMHIEHFSVNRKTLEKILNNYNNLTIVGTTCVRSLESLYCIARQVYKRRIPENKYFFVNQWEAYSYNDDKDTRELLENLYNWMLCTQTDQLNCSTQIMIVPSYKFKLTKNLITNFHQPKSSLLLLIAAFVGKGWKKIYEHAINNQYRFLSYGDSMMLSGKLYRNE